MTKDEKNGKLPGSRLLQFAERFFGQPGLEKIALPVIADLQHEYSSRPEKSLTRFLILLRGYLCFWKATGIYSLFSSRGDIRPFKSTGFVVLLGASVGIIISLLSWKLNQTPNLVSLFPNILTFLAFICLLFVAIWFCARQLPVHSFAGIWKVAYRISITIGLVFGTINVFIVIRQFQSYPDSVLPDFIYLGIGFLGSMLIVLVFGMTAGLLVWGMYALGKRTKAV